MELVDALSVIMEVGMSSEILGSPLASIIIASIISAMVWAVAAVIIPEA